MRLGSYNILTIAVCSSSWNLRATGCRMHECIGGRPYLGNVVVVSVVALGKPLFRSEYYDISAP